MQFTVDMAFDKIEEMDGLIKVLNNGCDLSGLDRSIIAELLSDYRSILLNAKITI